ncbi:MAG: hypothetical protein WDA24_02140 [Tissierellales bacterium]
MVDTKTLLKDYDELQKLSVNGKGNKKVGKIRDLSVLNLIGDIKLIIACDSNASNGEKPNDTHKNNYGETAISALKVPLMEVLATGAMPLIIANNLCVEMEPHGKRIIEIMKNELENAGLWGYVQLTGSTEDNMITTQTGIGVTVIGIASNDNFKVGKTQAGDFVMCIGLPQSGIEKPYSEKDYNVAKISTVKKLRELEYVHEILPVGSKGALFEANELAKTCGQLFIKDEDCKIDLLTSAGSSTAVLASIHPNDIDRLVNDMDIIVYKIGKMVK